MASWKSYSKSRVNKVLAMLVGKVSELFVGYGSSSGRYPKIAAGRRDLQNSGEAQGLGFQIRERDAERVVAKAKQLRDGACERRLQRKDDRVAATVVPPVQWAVMHVFGWACEAVINGTAFCGPGSN